MEKVLTVMQTLHIQQAVAAALLDSHSGSVSDAVEATLDGHHG
jgi:hypothetical protein